MKFGLRSTYFVLRTSYFVLFSCLLLGCNKYLEVDTGRPDVEPAAKGELIPVFATGSYNDNLLGQTRALPPGFSIYDPAEVTNIDIFLGSNTAATQRGTFSNATGRWRSDLAVENGQVMYIYGLLPKEACVDARVAPLEGSMTNGAVMTLEGLSPLSTTDVCVIVGVRQGDSRKLPITEIEDLRQGQFSYTGQSAAEGNYVYLLLNHIYASLGFQFRVDATYSELRTIVLKKVQLSTTSASAATATVTLKSNSEGEDPIKSVTWAKTDGNKEITIFDEPDGQTLTTSFADLNDCVFANLINGDVTMRCTYDVYDKAGNLTRGDVVSENKLPPMTIANRGERTRLRLTVNPTYLYVLSDADLDNPTLTIE